MNLECHFFLIRKDNYSFQIRLSRFFKIWGIYFYVYKIDWTNQNFSILPTIPKIVFTMSSFFFWKLISINFAKSHFQPVKTSCDSSTAHSNASILAELYFEVIFTLKHSVLQKPFVKSIQVHLRLSVTLQTWISHI